MARRINVEPICLSCYKSFAEMQVIPNIFYIFIVYHNLINDNMKNICITRLIYLLEENLDKVDSLKIEFEIDGAMKVFEM